MLGFLWKKKNLYKNFIFCWKTWFWFSILFWRNFKWKKKAVVRGRKVISAIQDWREAIREEPSDPLKQQISKKLGICIFIRNKFLHFSSGCPTLALNVSPLSHKAIWKHHFESPWRDKGGHAESWFFQGNMRPLGQNEAGPLLMWILRAINSFP